MKILVTGSEGSLMQAVIPRLLAQGHYVYGADNLMRYKKRLGIVEGGYMFYKVDLTDPVKVNELMREVKPDMVIQAAARIYGVGGFNAYCADILGQDIALHNNVLLAATIYGVKRVVYISSSMVYENCPQDMNVPVTEDMPDNYPAPYTEYGLSKFTGERLSIAFSKQYGMDYTIWRPFNIITPYEKSEGELGTSHVFADYIKNIIVENKNPIPIIGDGSQVRCFTWIHEVAQAIADMSFDDRTKNQIFNLGNPEPISMKDLALIIQEVGIEKGLITPEEMEFESVTNYKNDVRVRIPDVSKAKELLGWEAKQKVYESIEKCLSQINI